MQLINNMLVDVAHMQGGVTIYEFLDSYLQPGSFFLLCKKLCFTNDPGSPISNLLIFLSSLRLTLCGIGGILLLSGLAVLTSIDQDDARHNFGHTGGIVPSTYKHEVVILISYYMNLTK